MAYHNSNVSNAFEGIVNSSICHLHQHLLNWLTVVLGIHKLSGSKPLGNFKLVWVDVNANNPDGSE